MRPQPRRYKVFSPSRACYPLPCTTTSITSVECTDAFTGGRIWVEFPESAWSLPAIVGISPLSLSLPLSTPPRENRAWRGPQRDPSCSVEMTMRQITEGLRLIPASNRKRPNTQRINELPLGTRTKQALVLMFMYNFLTNGT